MEILDPEDLDKIRQIKRVFNGTIIGVEDRPENPEHISPVVSRVVKNLTERR